MEAKYYVPEIDEFFDGFGYERLESKIWRDSKFIFRDLNVIYKQINNGEIRVKHLDREDIESSGFEMQSSFWDKNDLTRTCIKTNFITSESFGMNYRLEKIINDNDVWIIRVNDKTIDVIHAHLSTLKYGFLYSNNKNKENEQEDPKHIMEFDVKFSGTIKNKSEFKKLMIQLGIS